MTEVQYGPHPAPAPMPESVKKKRKWILPTAMLVGGLILGSASAGTAASKPAPTPTPAPVETKTVTETKEVEVEVTPPSCIEALDLAAEVVGILAKLPAIAKDSNMAAFNRDADGINAATERLKAVNEEMEVKKPLVAAATQSCRASAK